MRYDDPLWKGIMKGSVNNMFKMGKRFMALCLLAGLVLSACDSAPQTSQAPESSTAGESTAEGSDVPAEPEELTLPIVDEKLELSCWVTLGYKQQTVMSSWDSIEAFSAIEEKTNIHINWMHPPVGGENEQLNTMIAARNLPDIIYTNWDSLVGGPGKMISDGIIIDIDPLVQQYAPNLLNFWEENPELRSYAYTDENQCFSMPYYWPEEGGYLFHFGYVVRGDWAEKLNVKRPTNVDEWYDYLKAVKEGDPNGNGEADELPLVAQKLPDLYQTQRMYGIEPGALFYLEDGEVVSALDAPEYKDWLATMQKWYAEGLIDPDFLSTDRTMMDNKVLTNQAGAIWSGAGTGQLGLYMKQKQDEGDTTFSLDPVPMPTTADGERLGWLKIVVGEGAGITTTNQHPVETIKYFDYMFSDEGHLLSQLGTEGKAYTMEDGEVQFTEYCTNNPDGLSSDSAMILCGMAPWSFVGYQLADYWKYNISFTPQAASSDEVWGDYTVYKALTGLRFTTEETSQVASITNDLKALLEETVSRIILGQASVDDFDTFREQADQMQHRELLEIYRNAYERSLNR